MQEQPYFRLVAEEEVQACFQSHPTLDASEQQPGEASLQGRRCAGFVASSPAAGSTFLSRAKASIYPGHHMFHICLSSADSTTKVLC
mmetsp:Transcript_45724/g.106141  ORF Transcript_45724/g.106141 Transcript_45724/m.106141 type:complete len:87 (+) Transcript_45724:4099-4359(+)